MTLPISFLEKRLGGLTLDDFEIYLSETCHLTIESKEGSISSFEEAHEHGVAIRLFQKGRYGFCCSSSWDVPLLEKMVARAYEGLRLLEPRPIRLEALLPSSGPAGRPEKEKKASKDPVQKREKMELARELEREAMAFDPRIRRIRNAQYSEEEKKIIIRNSRGLSCSDSSTIHEISLMVVAEDRGEQQMAWQSDFSHSFFGISPKKTAGIAAEKAISQLGGQIISTRKTPVVLDSLVAASFLGVLSSSFLGDQVQKNRSALRNRLGQKIYSPQVTIVDDGRLEGGYASFLFDGEGVERKRHEVVSQGELREFLHDSGSAAEAGCASTGNAIRSSYKDPPHPGATNFFILPGKGNLDRLIEEMGVGFWVRDVIGIHTADPVTGDFSLGASGIWIDGGKRQRPVRGVTLSGNLHTLFKNVVKAGEELAFYHEYGAPPLLIREMDVGGTS